MNLFKMRKEQLVLFHRNRKKPAVKKEIPDHVFKQCPQCHANISFKALKINQFVCPECNHHLRIGAKERIRQICDEFKEIDKNYITQNVENFPGYDQKLLESQKRTGLNEAVVCGIGRIKSISFALAVMDSGFMMGSMGSVVGEKITRCIEMAIKKKMPLIIFCTSGGARMQEGIVSLVQMAKTSAALKKLDAQGQLYISVLTHPTTGGVSASFAMLGDIIIAEPDCLVGFAGKRVIENTIKEKLPDNFQKAEFVLEKGFIDLIVNRKDLKQTLYSILQFHGRF
ncbi:acetyl-CoA carboxylase, carboxyltransferase subunit beta [Floccifex sp.]|uniref:acetyl-CoA carboxylase, carboxyltransferase subunit beta n=1 Tax=Floccifex sp. TaxID=2815810 RepID=UPI003F070830